MLEEMLSPPALLLHSPRLQQFLPSAIKGFGPSPSQDEARVKLGSCSQVCWHQELGEPIPTSLGLQREWGMGQARMTAQYLGRELPARVPIPVPLQLPDSSTLLH